MGKTDHSIDNTWQSLMKDLIKVPAKKKHAIGAKHKQIIDGACKVFFKKGFHPATIRELSESAGMTMGQMYHYISSKDDILLLMHKHVQESWYNYIKTSMCDEIEEPKHKLKNAIKLTLDYMNENKELIQFIYTESKYLNSNYLKTVLDVDNKIVVQFWRNLLIDIFGEDSSDCYIDLAGNLIAYIMTFYAMRGWNLKGIKKSKMDDFIIEFIFMGLNFNEC